MQTTVHAFSFDTNTPEGKAGYAALRERLKTWPHKMRSLTNGKSYSQTGRELDGEIIELETRHLFENQWNTAPIKGVSDEGLRVFDWAEDAIFDSYGRERENLRRGYYLDQTEEMREIRHNTNKCGYCGHTERAERGLVFCDHCRDSEYLKESDLYLTRMRSVDTPFNAKRPQLTQAEREHLLPLWKQAQLHGSTERGKKRIADRRARIEKEFKNKTAAAKAEHDGFIWLMDRGINIDNVIYYSHTAKFSFGWRQPVDKELESALLDLISEFPFPYEITCVDGRKLEAA